MHTSAVKDKITDLPFRDFARPLPHPGTSGAQSSRSLTDKKDLEVLESSKSRGHPSKPHAQAPRARNPRSAK